MAARVNAFESGIFPEDIGSMRSVKLAHDWISCNKRREEWQRTFDTCEQKLTHSPVRIVFPLGLGGRHAPLGLNPVYPGTPMSFL